MRDRASAGSTYSRTQAAFVHSDLRIKGYRDWKHFLASAEGWTSDQIHDYQLAELQRIVRHAYERTSYYRAAFDAAGITPDDIRSLDVISKLPTVDKETIRDHLEQFTVKIPHSQYVTTGGSTGIPFGFYRDRKAFYKELASKAHQYHRVGWKEGMRQLVFRGLVIPTQSHMRFYPRFNELRCSSYHLVPELMEVYRQRALTYQPEFLRCYPSSGTLFAKFLKETGREFPQLKGILCASENLYDHQKKLMNEVFGARVFSHYGHYEMAALAGFCEFTDVYHVLPQYGYAELIKPDGSLATRPGEVGEIVATSFIMHATPFIRYRTRDFAVFSGIGCSACGRPYQLWERIEGRLQEFIVTGSGRYISMTAINFHDNIFDSIQQFQFYQEQPGVVEFRYIPGTQFLPENEEDIARRLKVKLGEDMVLKLRKVDQIPPTKRGKHRFLIQKLPIEFHDQ